MKRAGIIVANLLIVAIVAAAVVNYAIVAQMNARNNEIDEFDRNNEILTRIVDDYIEDTVVVCQNWANLINHFNFSMKTALNYINISKTSEKVYGHLIWQDTLEGYTTSLDEHKRFIHTSYAEYGQEFFPKIDEIGHIHITSMYKSPVTGKNIFAFYTGVKVLNDEGKRQQAILLRAVETSYLHDRWSFSMGSYGDVVTALMQKDGGFVVPPDGAEDEELFEYLQRSLPGVDLESIRQAIDTDGTVTVTDASGKEYHFAFDGISYHDDWYVMSYLPIESLRGAGMDWTIPILIMVALISLLGLNMSFFSVQRRRDKEVNEDLTEKIETIKKQENVLREALRTAESANAAKSNFLANMSHDIRTPMNAIVGFSSLLNRDAENSEKVREHTKKIKSSAEHLLNLINDILDMSKIESGHTALNLSEFCLADVVAEVETIIRPQAASRSQSFRITLQNLINENIIGDKLRINEILLNLLSNAVKYTPVGGNIQLCITQLPQRAPNCALYRFEVTDNGVGMSESYQKIVFEPFTREQSSTTNKVRGTGLGMAITKELVDLMGGTISLKSKLGKGSVFTVELELKIQQKEVDQEFWREHGIASLLIVSDDTRVYEEMVGVMTDTGVTLGYAEDGRAALRMLRTEEDKPAYDLVLLRNNLPGTNGIATARRIEEAFRGRSPIMLLTGCDWTEIEEAATEAGIGGFLPRPFFLSNVRHIVRTLREQANEQERQFAQGEVFAGRHFLVAEDNELNAEILSELMEMVGATIFVAENGKVVVERFMESTPGQYDAILMDIQMPEMNGMEAARAIRNSAHPLAKQIPIVAMTANAFAEDVRDSLDAGMNAHVAKPVDMNRLAHTLERVFSGRNESVQPAEELRQPGQEEHVGFGVTLEEAKLGVADYNHALFGAQAFFTDICWEVHTASGMFVVMQDKLDPQNVDKQFSYMEFIRDYRDRMVAQADRERWMDNLSLNRLIRAKSNSCFEAELRLLNGPEYVPCEIAVAPYSSGNATPEYVYVCFHIQHFSQGSAK